MSRIFAIGDLHLPGGDDKPMEVFGACWDGHFRKIAADWQARVEQEDIVLIPGDISWAMLLENALPDLKNIAALPGRKILLRGNHDYWWGSISRLREKLPGSMHAIQNDALMINGTLFCGTRGWMQPTGENDIENARIYTRELMRLRLSLVKARELSKDAPLIAMSHFPPLGEGGTDTPVSAMLSEYGVRDAVYGHLHGGSLHGAFNGMRGGVRYQCVSCDGLEFKLHQLSQTVETAPRL